MDHGKLRRGVTRIFEDEALPFLEPGIAKAEGYIRDEHEAIQEANISVTIEGGLELTVSRTFKR